MELPVVLTSIVSWLRAGYPDGVPQRDYIPLLALLRRRLGDDEIVSVANQLIADGSASGTDIGVAITAVTDELPSDDDIERVRKVLRDAGWPPSSPDSL